MEIPQKFLKLISLINENLFYSDDDIVILEEEDVNKNEISETDIFRSIHFLKNKEVIDNHNIFYSFRIFPIRTRYKDKLHMLNHQGLASGFSNSIHKVNYVIKINSRDKFFEFYNKSAGKNNINNNKKEISFDKDKSILYINNEKVLISKKNDKSNAHLILEYIFDNEEGLSAKNYYSEMADKLFRETTNNNKWMKYYRACNDIQDKINKELPEKISDFLIIKTGETGYVQINSEYL